MFSTVIGTKLEKNYNEMEETKVDNVEEDQASVTLNKNKNEKGDAPNTSTKKWHSWKSRKIKGNVNEKVNTSITPRKNYIDTVNKTEK